MIGHGVISSYEGGMARVVSYDTPQHITPLLVMPEDIITPPAIGSLVAYAEFETNTGVVLAVMERKGE